MTRTRKAAVVENLELGAAQDAAVTPALPPGIPDKGKRNRPANPPPVTETAAPVVEKIRRPRKTAEQKLEELAAKVAEQRAKAAQKEQEKADRKAAKDAEKAAAKAVKPPAEKAPRKPRTAKAEGERQQSPAQSDYEYVRDAMQYAGTDHVHEFMIGDLDLRIVKQVRSSLHAEVVKEYAEAMGEAGEDTDNFPPIKVWVDHYGTPVLVAGWHRTAAYKALGGGTFHGIYVAASDEGEAIRLALEDNGRHGQRLTRKDMREAVKAALTRANFGGVPQTDRAIARLVGTTAPTVGAIRSELIEAGVEVPNAERLTASGTIRAVDTSAREASSRAGKESRQSAMLDKAADMIASTAEPEKVAPIFANVASPGNETRMRQLAVAFVKLDREGAQRFAEMIDRALQGELDDFASAREPVPELAAA